MADSAPHELTQSPQWIFEHVRSYIDEQLRLQQAEIDRRVDTVRRELAARGELTDRVLDERVTAWREALGALHREILVTNDASERAIAKAATATEHRLESVNEWRQQSLDRERSTAEERAKLHATLLPRETFETWSRAVERQLSERVGERREGRTRRTDFVANATLALLALSIVMAAVIAAATHGFH